MPVQSQLVKNNKILVSYLKICIYIARTQKIKNENIINAGYWVLYENRKS